MLQKQIDHSCIEINLMQLACNANYCVCKRNIDDIEIDYIPECNNHFNATVEMTFKSPRKYTYVLNLGHRYKIYKN